MFNISESDALFKKILRLNSLIKKIRNKMIEAESIKINEKDDIMKVKSAAERKSRKIARIYLRMQLLKKELFRCQDYLKAFV